MPNSQLMNKAAKSLNKSLVSTRAIVRKQHNLTYDFAITLTSMYRISQLNCKMWPSAYADPLDLSFVCYAIALVLYQYLLTDNKAISLSLSHNYKYIHIKICAYFPSNPMGNY